MNVMSLKEHAVSSGAGRADGQAEIGAMVISVELPGKVSVLAGDVFSRGVALPDLAFRVLEHLVAGVVVADFA